MSSHQTDYDHYRPECEIEFDYSVGPEQDPRQAAAAFLESNALPCQRHSAVRIVHGLLDCGPVWSTPFPSKSEVPKYRLIAERGECPLCRERQRVSSYGLPAKYLEATFENYQAKTDELRQNLAACRRYAANPQGFLVMLGKVGTGKTHLGAAILRSAKVGSALYIRQLDAVATMREEYGQRREYDDSPSIRRRLQSARLLVIDEAGVATGGNDADVLLHDVIDHRYGAMLPTILLANITPNEFEHTFGERIADRIREELFDGKALTFTGPSRRKEMNRFEKAR